MDISKKIAEMKKEPLFTQNVGMILVHNGVVRAWSRKDKAQVQAIEVTPDFEKIEEIRKEFEQKPGIYKIIIEAKKGTLKPGDDLLFIIVAGDIREHVKPVLAEVLDKVKKEAISKKEVVDSRSTTP
ncbi:molybdenum cofactor biosynthesis protein MoaE [Desulfohalobiaceae bacterium Ax17]|uniref:molybdenum cofactor biosynthesis protein MoaE n=1 Tax=Desulfovulcanus ferrireducens TaxID=2831190 RepID=UPI00207BA251|nr:molybdenum cofactor biosynthesis protein MoaE [Desulfovulcanus ferrireducens]MBT8762655.1 molybdenum cofactor biosynthesis protein MoaE [Desulfovulcanus ferrireducens]